MDLVGQVAFAARVVVAGTLLVAAWAKLRNLRGFAAGVRAYGLLATGAERLGRPQGSANWVEVEA